VPADGVKLEKLSSWKSVWNHVDSELDHQPLGASPRFGRSQAAIIVTNRRPSFAVAKKQWIHNAKIKINRPDSVRLFWSNTIVPESKPVLGEPTFR